MRKLLAPKNMLFFCTQYVSFKHTFHCHTYEYKKKYYIFMSTDSDKQTMTMRMSGKKSHRFSFVFFSYFFRLLVQRLMMFLFYDSFECKFMFTRNVIFFLLLSCHAHTRKENREKNAGRNL